LVWAGLIYAFELKASMLFACRRSRRSESGRKMDEEGEGDVDADLLA
jgi:hypothetical protein